MKKLKYKKYVIIDDDNVDVLDWIHSVFKDNNYHKTYEATIMLREINYREDNGEPYYVDSNC